MDSSQVRSSGGGGRSGRGGGIAVGGGASIIIVILALLFGFNPGDLLGGGTGTTTGTSGSTGTGSGAGTTDAYADCETGADIEANPECRWVAYTNSIQAYWTQALPGYQVTETRTFSQGVQTACGQATSDVGPFYCPADQYVYLDTSFFEGLLAQLGAEGGYAAEAYVIAHEYGHHIQNLTGTMEQVQRQGQTTGPDSPAVRLELQADCYAGVWFRFADNDPDGPIAQITQDDLNRAIDAAETVGDDHIQETMQGTVTPENWTHGSSEQRKQWLWTGYETGDPNRCNTFSAGAMG
nr:neutral zinc metallopeptidase [Propioniciclava soli]